jgi:hypothetical protein
MTLPTYNVMPPVSPPHKPTPTIPQMEDQHERDKNTPTESRIMYVMIALVVAAWVAYVVMT